MSNIEFQAWPKISRLYRDCVITEKIDGTNAAIGIETVPPGSWIGGNFPAEYAGLDKSETGTVVGSIAVYAQSRKRIITPEQDNAGFARWVYDHAEALASVLGPGIHYGEWWGSGIQRGYGLPKGEKRFSLFNTKRWEDDEANLANAVEALRVVPVLYHGPFDTRVVDSTKELLSLRGSYAAPGFMNPEGVVIYHTAANVMFKSTLENDEVPKEVLARRNLRAAA